MTITKEAVASALEAEWPGVEIKDIRPLLGGQWATMAQVRLAGSAIDGLEDAVVRVVPDAVMGAKELAVQAAAADAGIRTPRVHLSGLAGGALGGAWALMDFAVGRPLLGGLDGVAAVRRLPALARALPRQLAETMTTIHAIDPEPIRACVEAAAPTASLGVEEVTGHLHDASVDEPSLRPALEHLRSTMPALACSVLCHGDVHPFNLLMGDDGGITVLDWTAAAIAPAAYDVAATWLLLRHPPLAAPPALRPVIGAGASIVARRFVRSYRRANPAADLAHLDWYIALHSCRVLLDLARWQSDGDARAQDHPWCLVAPGAARALQRATGIAVPLD